ncbi:hypothetical protein EYF80_065733 [Liparis tanakae]|uniref:Uncharacterized protein n=1 Tax=Liparis tanakae TaxID=230148 RepID=A0A4Z2E6B3_9TELE|nr:hypothetical protein EYF80_065733 [Liparis tanakae]
MSVPVAPRGRDGFGVSPWQQAVRRATCCMTTKLLEETRHAASRCVWFWTRRPVGSGQTGSGRRRADGGPTPVRPGQRRSGRVGSGRRTKHLGGDSIS